MKTLTVALPGRSYDILIQRGLLAQAGEHCRQALPRAGKLFVVTDSNVGPLYLKRIIPALEAAGFEADGIEEYLVCWRMGDIKEQLTLLSRQRAVILDRLHREEKQIDCLDYLVYQIGKGRVSA